MILEVYSSEKGNCITTVSPESLQKQPWVLEDDSVLLRTIKGSDYDDCMRQHYELMGWNPYVPFTA
jgi:hypothetical protein